MKIIKLQLILFLIILCSHAHGFNSRQEWREYKETNSMSVCFDQGIEKILWDKSSWCNTNLPDIFNNNTTIAFGTVPGVSCNAMGSTTSMVVETLSSFGPIGAVTDILKFINICTNGYVLAPHEIMNDAFPNLNTQFTEYDIPYMFHCDPSWDPTTNTTITVDNPRYGRTKGFAPPSMPYCSNPNLTDIMKSYMKNYLYRVGYIVDDQYYYGEPKTFLSAGQEGVYNDYYRAYYNLNDTTGKLELCVSTENLGGISLVKMLGEVILGCTSIAPVPDELFDCDDVYRDTRFSSFCTQQGRCHYLGTSRNDLSYFAKYGLSGAVNSNAPNVPGPDGLYVKKFLQSDFHVTSVIIGCVQDLLIGLFSGPVNMFQQFQFNLKGMVLATLTLYLALAAIKTLLRASNPLSRGEFVMYIVKFALVYAFAAGGGWYNTLPSSSPTSQSLVASMIQIPNTIANWFMTAQNVNDPMNYCQLNYNNQNILSERDVATPSNGFDTYGFSGTVKLSVWDLVDCKLANYLSFGSCDFSVGGLVSVWLIGACLFAFPNGIILAIIMLIYVVSLFFTVFRIAQIFILSLFAITILVFVSPIFMLFWLFDYTKSIFEGWAAMLLGYILYPALLFAFLALMIATFDSVFYGFNTPIDDISKLKDMCKDSTSVFCTMYNHLYAIYNTIPNLCSLPFGGIVDALLDSYTVPFIAKFYYTTPEAINALLLPMVKIMALAMLFKFFMHTMISTLASILGVIDLQTYAKGANFIKDVVKIATKVASKAASGRG